jgi:hypothetical protein
VLSLRLVVALTAALGCVLGCSEEEDRADPALDVSALELGFPAKDVGSIAVPGLCITGDDPVELLNVDAQSAEQNLEVTAFAVVSVPFNVYAEQAKPLDETGWMISRQVTDSNCRNSTQSLGLQLSKGAPVGRLESIRLTYRVEGREESRTVDLVVTMCSRFKDCRVGSPSPR